MGEGAGAGVVGWTLRGAGSAELDGLPTEVAAGDGPPDGRTAPTRTAPSPSTTWWRSPGDFGRTTAALEAAGLALRRVREVPGRDGVRQGFFLLGTSLLELAGPVPGHDHAAFWGLTIAVADLDAAAALLGDRLGEPRDAVQPGRRIATVRPEAGSSVALALMTPRAPGSA